MGTHLNMFEVWARRRRILTASLVLLSLLSLARGARVPGVEKECNSIANMVKSKNFTYPWSEGGGVGSRNPFFGNSSSSTSPTSSCPIGKSGDKSTKCCKELDSPLQRSEMKAAFGERWLGPKLTANGDIFKEKKKKFDVTFKDLLTRAHAAFHAMFERTYGMLYIQHAPIFHALFTTLEAYYDAGRDSLEGKLNEFFAILTRKMFVVLNSQYEFDDTYLSCAAIVISEKQGGDLHRQIVSSLRRSFVATRALAQGLNDADRVFHNLHKLKLSQECTLSLSQMLQCPICTELRSYKPCAPLCIGVTSQCLSPTFALSKPWTEFCNIVENVVDRLLGPYNVEAVVEPIHIKISEAIMNFQESGPDLSQAVFSKCGKAKLKSAKSRRRRGSGSPKGQAPEELRRRPEDGTRKGGGGSGGTLESDGFRANIGHGDIQPSKSLEKLLREIKNKVRKSKNVWDILPRQVCNGVSKDYSSQLCWNGTAAIKLNKNKTGTEEEVRPPTSGNKVPMDILVAEQIIILQQITEKLRASYNGLDVQWVEDIKDDLEFEGSGMGSGSGEIPTDLEDSDDDDPSGRLKPERKRPPTHSIVKNNDPYFPPRQPAPTYPKLPSRPAPPILKPTMDHEDEEDEDDGEDIDVGKWDPNRHMGPPDTPYRGGGGFTIDGPDGTDFVPFPPSTEKKPRPSIVIPSSIPTTTSTTTRRPTIDVTRTKHPSSSSGTMDEAGKAIGFFKLFSPIFASLVGKAFSFT